MDMALAKFKQSNESFISHEAQTFMQWQSFAPVVVVQQIKECSPSQNSVNKTTYNPASILSVLHAEQHLRKHASMRMACTNFTVKTCYLSAMPSSALEHCHTLHSDLALAAPDMISGPTTHNRRNGRPSTSVYCTVVHV
jgi:hypothetical protein